jgi:sugar-specific transcriptional regulator TrmB
MKQNISEKLLALGFSSNESKVYTALLELGQTSTGPIIRKTQLHRSVVYETLDKLIDRNLIFKLNKHKISYFQATDPTIILDNAEREQKIAQGLVPELKKFINTKLPEINVYQGQESYGRFWLDSYKNLPIGTIDYVSNSVGKRWQELTGNYYKEIMKVRQKREIKWKMIVMEKDDIEMDLIKKYPSLHEYRIIKKEIHRFGNFNILGDKSVILQSTTEPMIIEIKNETLVKVFQNIFDILWESGKKI